MDMFTKLRLYYRSLKPILLSHHPDCETFREHTFKIGKKKFCIGCFIGYPIAFIGVITIYFISLVMNISSQILFITGTILMAFFVLSPLKLAKKKLIKILQKVLFNLGGAFIFWWILSFPNPLYLNIILAFFIFSILLLLVNSYHAYNFYRTCKKCKFSLDWENCPGFKDLFEYCTSNNLPNLFKINSN